MRSLEDIQRDCKNNVEHANAKYEQLRRSSNYSIQKFCSRYHKHGNEQQSQIQLKLNDPNAKVFETFKTDDGKTVQHVSRCATDERDWVTKIHNQIL